MVAGKKLAIARIPENLVLLRLLAARNDPTYLEEKDIQDFLDTFQIPHEKGGSPGGDFKNKSLGLLKGRAISRNDVYRLADSSLRLVRERVAGNDHLTIWWDSKFVKFFGDSSYTLLPQLEEAVKNNRFVLNQSAKFQGSERLKELLSEAHTLVTEAMEEFNGRFGLEVKAATLPLGVIHIKDHASGDLQNRQDFLDKAPVEASSHLTLVVDSPSCHATFGERAYYTLKVMVLPSEGKAGVFEAEEAARLLVHPSRRSEAYRAIQQRKK